MTLTLFLSKLVLWFPHNQMITTRASLIAFNVMITRITMSWQCHCRPWLVLLILVARYTLLQDWFNLDGQAYTTASRGSTGRGSSSMWVNRSRRRRCVHDSHAIIVLFIIHWILPQEAPALQRFFRMWVIIASKPEPVVWRYDDPLAISWAHTTTLQCHLRLNSLAESLVNICSPEYNRAAHAHA